MKASILTDGRYGFMQCMEFPLEVECELSPAGNVACTPEQLKTAGVPDVPSKFCCIVWYFKVPDEAVIIEE
jgi:hypothetical protein